jgi:tetratricopeptide (TPR) repeat protein
VCLQELEEVSCADPLSDETVIENIEKQEGAIPNYNKLLRNYFLQYRTWCIGRDEMGLARTSSGPSMVRLYFHRETESRIDILRRVSTLTPEEYHREMENFTASVQSQEYENNPTTYSDSGMIMCMMQDVCRNGDVVLMRTLCSFFAEMGLYSGCVAIQRQLLRVHVNAHPNGGGEVAMSVALESLSCALLMEGTVESIEEAVSTSEESLTMREGFHMAELKKPGSFPQYKDITQLLDMTLLHARIHYEAGDVKEAQSVLLKAIDFGADGSRRGLSIVKHHAALFYVIDGSYKHAISAYEEALASHRQCFGARHPLVAAVMLDLCRAQTQAGNYDLAVCIGKQGLTIRLDACGMKHLSVADALLLVTPALNLVGRAADSKAYIEKAVIIRQNHYGWLHSSIAECFVHYATVCKRMNHPRDADSYIQLALQVSGRNTPYYTEFHFIHHVFFNTCK